VPARWVHRRGLQTAPVALGTRRGVNPSGGDPCKNVAPVGHRKTQMTPGILLLGSLPPPYMGTNVATRVILGSSLSSRYQLIHLDTSDRRPLTTLGRLDWVNVSLAVKHYARLLILIVRWRPHLVYFPISQTTIGYLRDSVFILMSKALGRRVVCHLHGGNFRNWFDGCFAPMRFYVRAVHSLVDGQIVLGKSLRSLFSGLMPDSSVFVVPNGMDFPFRWETKSEAGRREVRVLYLSNFIRSKGVLDVLRAALEVHARCPWVEFSFAGEWGDKETKEEVDGMLRLSKGGAVRFLGSVYGEEKYRLLQNSDLFVFPTYYPPEGHPLVIVEAMAAGLPIVTTDHGTIAEWVEDGVNGFIVKPRSPGEVAEKILALANDEGLRIRMGAESRRRYEAGLTEANMVEALSNAFEHVLSKDD
jgi:glycosyltransferase involved in cell wall biosynthesis